MLKDHNHDLVHHLSEVSDGLWRLEKYAEAAKECETCTALWGTVREDLERHSRLLQQEIKKHIDAGAFE